MNYQECSWTVHDHLTGVVILKNRIDPVGQRNTHRDKQYQRGLRGRITNTDRIYQYDLTGCGQSTITRHLKPEIQDYEYQGFKRQTRSDL